jgi:hypothetical protein
MTRGEGARAVTQGAEENEAAETKEPQNRKTKKLKLKN